MKKLIYFLLLLGLSGSTYAQFKPPVIEGYQNGDTVYQKVLISLTRNSSSTPESYMIEVSESKWFNGSNDMELLVEKSRNIELEGLAINTSYYIRARVFSSSGISLWSQVLQLSVGNSVKGVRKVGPYSKPFFRPVLYWDKTYATGYIVQFDSTADFSSPALHSDTVGDTNHYSYYPVNHFRKFYARVAPVHKNHSGLWTVVYFGDFSKPLVTREVAELRTSAAGLKAKNHVFSIQYRYQVAYDSLFTSIIVDSIGSRSTQFKELPYDTTLYFRSAFVLQNQQSSWSQHTLRRFLGPGFRQLQDGDEVANGQRIEIDYYFDDERFEREVSKDSLFQDVYNYSWSSDFYTPYKELRQFLRFRAIHSNDTSSWTTRSVFVKKSSVRVSFNNGSIEKEHAPGGILSFQEDEDDLSKIWVELDITSSFDSDSKIELESLTENVTVPDLKFNKNYFMRYRLAYGNGYEERSWSRSYKFTTVDMPSMISNTDSFQSVFSDFECKPVPYFTGGYQFQIYTDVSRTQEFLYLDTILDQSVLSTLLPFTSHLFYYRVRLVNERDSSRWGYSNRRSYVSPTLVAPIKGAVVQGDAATLQWQDQVPECKYTVQIDTLPFKNKQQGTILVSAGNNLPEIPMVRGKKYYWRAQAFTALDTSEWSEVATFVADDNSSLPGLPAGTVQVYPNPACHQLVVLLDGAAQVQLFALQGQQVLRTQGEKRVELELISLPSGMYILEVRSPQGLYRQKIEKL